MPLAHLGTAKAQPFGLFPHTDGRPDPTERLHTTARSPRAHNSPQGPALLHSLQRIGAALQGTLPRDQDCRSRLTTRRDRLLSAPDSKDTATPCPEHTSGRRVRVTVTWTKKSADFGGFLVAEPSSLLRA